MNFRISNNLFESIRNVTNPQVKEPAKVEEAEVDKAHFCATHVEHALLGLGTCISEQHAEPDEQGQISWYTVEFPTGTHRIQTSNLRIVEGKSHTHGKKMAEAEEKIEEKKLHPNQQVLDVHEPEKDELTADDFKKLRAGKKANAKNEEVEIGAVIHPKSGKEIGIVTKQPNGEGYHALHSAASLAHKQTGTFDSKDKAHQFIHDAHAKAIKNNTLSDKFLKKNPSPQLSKEEVEELDELSVGTLLKVKSAASRAADDATRDGNDAKADKRYDLAGKANNKIELKHRALGLKPSGQHTMDEGNDGKKKVNEAEDDMHPDAGTLLKHIKPEHHDTYKPYLTKTVFNGSIKDRRDVLDAADAAGHLKDDRGPRGVTQEAHNNPFDVKNYKSQIPTKPGENAGFDSKKISTGTVYTKKFTKEKPEPAGKAFKPKAVKEGISQTIINYDDFRIDVTDNPTYGDYLRALQTMVESRDENIQQEVVAIATAAYNDKIDSIIIESKARQIFAGKLDEIRKSGSTVLDESYIVESNSTYVEYTVEKDGVRTQYVHIGTNGNK